MVVVFANQKGGVGKTTLAIAYANHLADTGHKVLLIDIDIQQSCISHRKSELNDWSEDAVKYKIEYVNLSTVTEGVNLMKQAHQLCNKESDCTVLIDVPGNITESYLGPVFIYSDFIVCPFVYQKFSLKSTSTFVKVIEQLKISYKEMTTKMLFVPNKVQKRFGLREELEENRKFVDDRLRDVGVVTPVVYERAELKRISTILWSPKHKEEFKNCFACIDSNIFSEK